MVVVLQPQLVVLLGGSTGPLGVTVVVSGLGSAVVLLQPQSSGYSHAGGSGSA